MSEIPACLISYGFNSTPHQSPHDFAVRVHGFAAKTKALAREIPPATQAKKQVQVPMSGWHLFQMASKKDLLIKIRSHYTIQIPTADKTLLHFPC